jgi:hypothetical protein
VIVIQALIPAICTLPAIFFFIIILLFYDGNPTAVSLTIFRYGENQENRYTMIDLCFLIVTMLPVLDPFITLRVVKSYRGAANQFLKKFKIYRKFTATGSEETVIDTVHVYPRLRPGAWQLTDVDK